MHLRKTSSFVYALLAASMLLLTACPGPVPPDPTPPIDAHANEIYVLNEGTMEHNNSSISYYDIQTGTFTPDIFLTANHRGLGDTGNDLQRYGAKLYAVVNVSNRVEVMNFADATSLKSISLDGKQPRYICFLNGKAFVSCFDGDVVRIDTATLEIDGTVRCGRNPEGICVCNHKLYVANSGGLDNPNYDNTVSVIDPSSMTVTKTVTVGINPYLVEGYNDQYVYVNTRGNYMTVPYDFYKIDATTDEVVKDYGIETLNFKIHGDKAYVYSYNFTTFNSWIKVLDLRTDELSNGSFITDGTTIETPYSISVNPLNGDVYITDVHNFTVTGDVYCFGQDGRKKFSFEAGINPSKIVFNSDINLITKL